jgi:UDP-galactopyranose mutase
MFIRDIIVFSHLRWNFVFQRPQHLLSRLASGRRVFFIEEPIRADGSEDWKKYEVQNTSVSVCTPVTPIEKPGFCTEQLPHLKSLVSQLTEQINPRAVLCGSTADGAAVSRGLFNQSRPFTIAWTN